MLAAIGGVTSGWSLYVKDGKPTFYCNFFEVDHARVQASESPAERQIERAPRIHAYRAGPGKPADVKLFVNGKEAAHGVVGKTVPFRYSVEPFDIGRDTVSAVSKDYRPPFAFPGKIEQVTVEVK